MGTGIGASLTTFSSGTTISSSSVNGNFTSLNNSGISNDSGNISTNGSGQMTLPGLIVTMLDAGSTGVTVTGTTAGNATIYQVMRGTFKIVALLFNGYQNSSGTEQKIALPVAFTQRAMFMTGNAKSTSIWSGGSQLTNKINTITALASGGGTTTGTTIVPSNSIGEIIQGFDTVGLGTGEASQAYAISLFYGI
jgi:hypothetical protein